MDLTAMLEPRVELSQVRMKRKDDPDVLSSAFTVIKNKDEDAGVSVDELVAALIAAVPKDDLSSINTQKCHLE